AAPQPQAQSPQQPNPQQAAQQQAAQQQAMQRQRAPKPVRLGDVATVERGLAEASTITRTGGQASLGVTVTMVPDGNAVAISEAVREKLPELTRAVGDSSDTAIEVVF